MRFHKILTTILYPFIYFFFLYRKYKGKEDQNSFSEKLGYIKTDRPKGYLIWIHVASVGEYLSIKLLIDKLIEKYNANILVTTITLSAAKLIKDKPSLIHQYFPIDNKRIIKKFLLHWQPNLTLWVESELWPNISFQTSKVSPIILLNAKLSDKSYKRWLFFKKTLEQVLKNFSLILPQSINDYNRFRYFKNNNLKFIGNIKYAAVLDKTAYEISYIHDIFPEEKFILIAASTHKGEELLIADGYGKLKKKFPNMFLIIVPRHPNRLNDILEDLKGFNISIRSKNEIIDNNTDIYIVDTIGELRYFYEISNIAFIGGSFSSIGGHNPLEAANAGCAIIYGPCYSGFKEIISELINVEAVQIINSSEEYKNIVEKLFTDKKLLDKMKLGGKKLVTEKSSVIDKYLNEIDQYIQIRNN